MLAQTATGWFSASTLITRTLKEMLTLFLEELQLFSPE